MKKYNRHSVKGLAIMLALTLILSMMPVTTAWADSPGSIFGGNSSQSEDTVNYKWPKISDLIIRTLRPVYVKVDMGEGHEELAQAVCESWSAILADKVSGMDFSEMGVEGSVVTIAVPARPSISGTPRPLISKGFFETYMNGVIIRAATGKKLNIGSVKVNGDVFAGIGDNDIGAYLSSLEVAQEYAANVDESIKSGDDYFALWEKPITEIALSVGAPVCGTQAVSTVSKFNAVQENSPVVASNSADFSIVERIGNDKYGVSLPIWSTVDQNTETILGPAAELENAVNEPAAGGRVKDAADQIKAAAEKLLEKIREAYSGSSSTIEFRGGETYYANVVLAGRFGTYFANDIVPVVLINGKEVSPEEAGYVALENTITPALLRIPVKAEHDWDEGVIVKKPTLKADGSARFTCRACGETKTEPVSNESVIARYKKLKAKYTPAKGVIKSVKTGAGKAKIFFKKQSRITGFQVKLISRTTGKSRVYKAGKTFKNITWLKECAKYSVRIRAYKKIEGYTFYGKWSNLKTFKTGC